MASPAPSESELQRGSLQSAGNLLFAIGVLSAVAGGFTGMEAREPGVVVASFLLLLGYGVAGYLLLTQGERAVRLVGALAGVLILFTLWLVPGWVAPWDEFASYIFLPALTVLLAYAAGGFVAAAFGRGLEAVPWPQRRNETAATLLQLASIPPVWGAYLVLEALGGVARAGGAAPVLVGLSFLAAAGGVAAGYLARAGRHPGVVLGGGMLTFFANVAFVFEFLGVSYGSGPAELGALLALLGMLASGFPIALSIVAWYGLTDGAAEAPPSS